jgi:polyisoprenoid-binding protein YceI
MKISKDNIKSLRGDIVISLVKLHSDNGARDKNMYETIDVNKYKMATYTVTHIKKIRSHYNIYGILNLHGVKKAVVLKAFMKLHGNKLRIKSQTSFKMTDFNIAPPKLLIWSVRDTLRINIDTTYYVKK